MLQRFLAVDLQMDGIGVSRVLGSGPASRLPAPVRWFPLLAARRRRRASRFRAPFRERKTPRGRGAHREFKEVLGWGRRARSGARGERQFVPDLDEISKLRKTAARARLGCPGCQKKSCEVEREFYRDLIRAKGKKSRLPGIGFGIEGILLDYG